VHEPHPDAPLGHTHAVPHPAPPVDTAQWRLEVAAFRRAEQRKVFPVRLHVGRPAGERVWVDTPWREGHTYDDGLRMDVCVALLDRWRAQAATYAAGAPYLWLSRPGGPQRHDLDAAWAAAAARAWAAEAVPVAGFRVVTKHGWSDPVSGAGRTWRRLRL
jgi:hypothetical protein